jgi:predicted RND superfamily exporter protein
VHNLSQVTKAMEEIDGVAHILNISNVEGAAEIDGVINVGPITQVTPASQWAGRILNDVLLVPSVISKDGRTVLVFAQLKNANVGLLVKFQEQFRAILNREFPHSVVRIGGVPAVQTDLGLLLNKELVNFIMLTIAACALTLFLIFRTRTTILIPLVLTALANVMVFAMMAWSGLPFTILSSTIPILVFITVVSVSVHFILRLTEHHAPHGIEPSCLTLRDKWAMIWSVHTTIWLPNLLGAFTTCVGFLTLLSGKVPLIRNYGLGVAAAVLLSWLITSIGLLPLLLLLPKPQPRAWVSRPARWALWTIRNAKPVVFSVAVLCLLLVGTSRHLYWTGRLFDDLPSGQEARQSTEWIDQKMGGVIPLEVVIRAKSAKPWSDPARLAQLKTFLAELRSTPGVGSARSLPDFFHVLETLPHPIRADSEKSIDDIYFLYSLGAVNPVENFLADQNQSVRIELRLHDLPSGEMQELVARVKNRASAIFPADKVSVGGMGAIVHVIHDELSRELIFGFWQALALVVILLAFVFRSLRWALVACLPNLVPPIALLGYLSLTQTPIKPGVAIIFSIALGLAFNNTVYVLNRLRELKTNLRPLPVSKAFYVEGNPCLVATLIMLVGFSVFLFSYFSLNRTFGACMLVSMLGGLLGDLIFLPALLHLVPGILEPAAVSVPGTIQQGV